jgi:hypothetical protein
MKIRGWIQPITRAAAAGAGLAVTSYATYAAITWARYGHPKRSEEDGMLDRFMPAYEVVERHKVRVAASPAVTFRAACEMDLEDSAIIRGIFKARELFLGGVSGNMARVRGIVAQTKALGWGALAEIPDSEIVMGAVTQPWVANPVFRALAPDEFASFQEPGFVRIVWNLRADPVSECETIFRTETRAVTTDAPTRARFRIYWSFASPGIWLIRHLSLGPLKREAERRFRAGTTLPARAV